MHQAIQDGVGQGWIGDLGKPVGDRHLGGDDGRCLAVAIIQNFQDVLGVGGGELIAQPIIQNEQVGAGQGAQENGMVWKAVRSKTERTLLTLTVGPSKKP
jgi:hypothetical protein